jgi:acetoin utilization deacetylase AcuC-like enzyme
MLTVFSEKHALRDSKTELCGGATIAGLNLPTLFVMEGGYAVEEIGVNTVNVLEGYEAR